jgi:cell division protein FtsW (lipid II flippase)
VYLAYQAYQIYRAFQAAGWDRHRIIPAAEVVALGVVLQFLKGRPWVSSGVRPFVPLVQPAVVFLFLGGDSTLLATIVIGFVMIVTQRSRLVPALEPWWGVQERIPALQRRVLSIAVPFAIGWWFGRHASGREWSRTALSMIFATTASFLLVFTPPHALRRRTPRKPA